VDPAVEDVLERLEQISAIVVAVGLALVSYWLFFSWAGGGDVQNRHRPDARDSPSRPVEEHSGRRRGDPAPDGHGLQWPHLTA